MSFATFHAILRYMEQTQGIRSSNFSTLAEEEAIGLQLEPCGREMHALQIYIRIGEIAKALMEKYGNENSDEETEKNE